MTSNNNTVVDLGELMRALPSDGLLEDEDEDFFVILDLISRLVWTYLVLNYLNFEKNFKSDILFN